MISAGLPAAIAGLAVLVLWLGTGGLSSDAGGPATTAAATPRITPGTRPPDIPIAKVGLVSLRLPVDRNRLTAIAFHPVDNPQAVEMEPAGSLDHQQAPRNGRPGPERGAIDVGAAAQTPVFSPVDGTVAGVGAYVVQGRLQGSQLTIKPIQANGYAVMITHIEDRPDHPLPSVGTSVTAGVTVLGQVRDFVGVKQELAQFTSDSGNHVQIEVIRTPIQ
jgi:murein DD-endopeptidase MepM/ murein hydrolase activator NlpD